MGFKTEGKNKILELSERIFRQQKDKSDVESPVDSYSDDVFEDFQTGSPSRVGSFLHNYKYGIKPTQIISKFKDRKDLRRDILKNTDDDQKFQKEGADHHALLKDLKSLVSAELIQDVYDHYPLFLLFSKEIEQAESELIEVGKLWNKMLSAINIVKNIQLSKSFIGEDDVDSNNFVSAFSDVSTGDMNEELNDILSDMQHYMGIQDYRNAIAQYIKGKQIIETNEGILHFELTKEFEMTVGDLKKN